MVLYKIFDSPSMAFLLYDLIVCMDQIHEKKFSRDSQNDDFLKGQNTRKQLQTHGKIAQLYFM